ncbi:MAG: enoyl-CoA hydratase/isomerase family protein [Burkholderiaceae bacterium]|jgi:enoyl-CoA hydratase/carnithine racemase|nr:enoyl-CoA hydratase/isomerase family protein [Burkholderiaceae bacterium]
MTSDTHRSPAAAPSRLLIDDAGVATLTIDVNKINVLDSSMIARLTGQIENLAATPGIRCLILRGNDKAFVSGASIDEMAVLDPPSARTFIGGLYRLCAIIHSAPFPVIARVHGWCFGAGAELATSCDIRVGSTASWYAMPEVKLGITSVIQAAWLPSLIGAGRARYWVLTGTRIDAKTALEWGYLNQLVDVSALDEAVKAVVDEIIACPPLAIRTQKQVCNQWEFMAPDDAARATIDVFGQAYETDEPRQAMQRFLQGRGRQ